MTSSEPGTSGPAIPTRVITERNAAGDVSAYDRLRSAARARESTAGHRFAVLPSDSGDEPAGRHPGDRRQCRHRPGYLRSPAGAGPDGREPRLRGPDLESPESRLVPGGSDAGSADPRTRREITSAYRVTAMVNNAGATRPGTIDTATLADFDYVVALHFRASMLLIQAALPALRASGTDASSTCRRVRRWASRSAWPIRPPRPD